ncbi:hypothetical protein C2S52_005929 [Perilla frutescens var. hirtella]|nr:hypothetical protein C2S52_005929 [Perilla frutescens var. hirtella]
MEENINDQLYIPQVGDDRKPKVEMKFASVDDAFSFYNHYAREAGFGHTDESCSNKRAISGQLKNIRARGEVRTNCKARLSLVKQQTGPNWIVSNFVEGHNHALSTPSKVHLLWSHRRVSTVERVLTQQFSEANVPTCQKIRLLEIEYGGPKRVGCTERDIRNFEHELRDEQKGIDAETLIEFFGSEKERNSAFVFDYETDSKNRLTRCFWADPTSRRAYSVFGDVIVFDSTYNTNKYGMIFAPFVGVNHHHQTIIFGCGFLSDEKIESYIWLFNKWLEAMPADPPKVIITDQDPALTNAIAKIVIENSTSVDEFERSWKEVIKAANLENDKWISLMYGLRHKWVPIYFSDIFCAGMSSSQRSKSSHSFLKKYVSNKNSLMDFITRFNRALRHQRHNELATDHIDVNEHPKIKTNWLMETQMVKVYTKKKWVEFQSEMSNSHGYFVQQESVRDDFVVYNVINSRSCPSSKPRVLQHDKEKDFISCSCRKFKFEGISCRHMLAFFHINQVFQLPEKYILKRWTRDAKIGAVYLVSDQNMNDSPTKFLMSRHSRLSCKASVIIDDASLIEEGTNFLDEQLDYIHEKIKEMSISPTSLKESQRRKNLDKTMNINDPSEIRTKGCAKRLQSSKEKSSLKARVCHGCGRTGVSHDKRNCPHLHDGSIRDDHHNNDHNSNEEDFMSTVGAINLEQLINIRD